MQGLYQIKASAGSGKTYTLTRRFLTLLENDAALRDILAITFTNAAAEEMRSRILLQLKKDALATEDASRSHKAHALLHDILYSYSALNVRTIDSLLLQIVRTAALPFGLAPDFQPVFSPEDTIAPFLDILSAKAQAGDDELDNAFTEAIGCLYNAAEAEGFRAIRRLRGILAPLFSAILCKECEELSPSKEVRKEWEESWQRLKNACKAFLTATQDKPWQKRAQTALEGLAAGETKRLSSTYLAKDSPNELFRKGATLSALDEEHFQTIKDLCADYTLLRAAVKTMPFIELGKRMVREYEAGEKATHALHMIVVPRLARAVLEGIIPVEEALFRLGNSTRHMLIDEFQDTSSEQWHALAPLVQNSLAEGGSLTWVGDIKQSIFSWRGGNPALFDALLQSNASGLGGLVEEGAIHKDVLPNNWRSSKTIVDFVNLLFSPLEDVDTARELVCDLVPDSFSGPERFLSKAAEDISRAFRDYSQTLPAEHQSDAPGYVELAETNEEEYCAWIAERILTLHTHRPWSDMLVLVRTNDQSTAVSEALLLLGIPVVTENSLLLAHQRVIIESVALLRFLLWREETAFVTLLSGSLLPLFADRESSLSKIFDCMLTEQKTALQVFKELYPTHWSTFFEPFLEARDLSPYDFIAEWYDFLRVRTRFPQESVFFDRFLEVLHRAENEGASTISSFLTYWEECHGDEKVPMPENMDAVRIMTIHKAKGLEAPVVFFPWKTLAVKTKECVLFSASKNGLSLALRMSKDTEDAYYTDYMRVFCESFNLLYVGATRPREELYLLHVTSAHTKHDLLQTLVEKAGLRIPQSFGKQQATKASLELTIVTEQESENQHSPLIPKKPMDWLPALKIEHTPAVTSALRAKDTGLFLHSALEWINPRQTIADSVHEAMAMARYRHGFLMTCEDEEGVRKALTWFLQQTPCREWLTNGLREQSLLDAKGHLLRCDLLVPQKDGSILLVDYKSGEPEEQHIRQMQRYAKTIAEGGKTVFGILVYLEKERFRKVTEKTFSKLTSTCPS